MGGSGLKSLLLESPLETEANTEIARRAGCSQRGQSAPAALMGWSFSNLLLQVGQWYSYSGICTFLGWVSLKNVL
jgi:hypothetical protein